MEGHRDLTSLFTHTLTLFFFKNRQGIWWYMDNRKNGQQFTAVDRKEWNEKQKRKVEKKEN
jgi:hypothetical protein